MTCIWQGEAWLPSKWRLLSLLALAAEATISTHRLLPAAPVTFAFYATINEITDSPDALSLPPYLSVGQQFTGAIKFEVEQSIFELASSFSPLPGGWHMGLAEGAITFSLSGNRYSSNVNFIGVNNGGLVDINDPPTLFPRSSISLHYIPLTDVVPGWGGGHWGAGLTLAGLEDIISEAAHVLDVGRWNQLTSTRQLKMWFGYPHTASVTATLGHFSLVPEPTTTTFLTCGLALVLVVFNRDGRRSANRKLPLSAT